MGKSKVSKRAAKQEEAAAAAAPAPAVVEAKGGEKEEKSPENLSLELLLKTKHPLNNKWAFWFLEGDRSKEWVDCLKPVVTIETVEEFWFVYKNILPPSNLLFGSDYYLFRNGVKPMWEDPQNVKGGRWFVVVDKHFRSARLDELWLRLMLAVVGEQFEGKGDHICGAAVNLRQKGDKVALWTSDATADKVNRKIGLSFKSKLNVVNESIRYEVHRDASARIGSIVKPKFVISNRNSSPECAAFGY